MATNKITNNITENRPKRVPLHEQKRNVLTASNRDPGYHYRFVNMVGDRVDRYKLAGYEVVDHETTVGDANQNVAVGSGGRASVGAGVTAVLMRIPKDIYEADQKAKQRDITEKEDLLIRKKKTSKESGEDGTYGEVSIGIKD